MKAPLDTHAFLWRRNGDPSLSRKAIADIANAQGDLLASAAPAWKIATKHRLEQLPRAGDTALAFMLGASERWRFALGPGERTGALPGFHRIRSIGC